MEQIQTAQEFFEHIIKILGENELYRIIYGELPVDKDSADRIAKSMQMYENAKPLLDEFALMVEKKVNKKGKK